MRKRVELTLVDLKREIKYRALMSGKTQEELSNEMGIAQSTLCEFLNNSRGYKPHLDTLLRYCDYFDIRLFYETEQK